MLRRLALLAAVLALAVPTARAGEPLDLDITGLGPPSAYVWAIARCYNVSGCDPTAITPADEALASDARMRFAMLSSELMLSLGSALLEPAATVGHSGFAFDLEVASTQVHKEVVGTAEYPAGSPTPAFPRNYWPTHTKTPSELVVPSFHVRKSLPYSLELGGRILYLSQSSYLAAQLSGKWAIQEGYARIPDVALLVAHTIFLGQKDLNLAATDFTLLVSKRFGVNAVTSFTPYLAARYLRMKASSDPIGYAPDVPTPASPPFIVAAAAEFPSLTRNFYRTTLGLRMTASKVTMAIEGTWFGGGSYAASADYPAYQLESSLGGAFKLGFEF
jgi:hypothetical protein